MRETIQEYATSDAALRVDRTLGVIPSVKVIGLTSKNGRTYTKECLEAAIPLYSHAPCFVDHAKPGSARSYRDKIGRLENVSAREDGLYADLHYNKRHALADQLVEDAETAPGNVGLSHAVEATTRRVDGKTVVEGIVRVESVDLVANPATTLGLFEGVDVPDDQRELCEHGLSAVSDARSILLGNEDAQVKTTRLLEVIAAWRAELAGEPDRNKEVSGMEWKEVTKESLAENCKELFAALTDTSALTKELEETKAALKEATEKQAAAEAERLAAAKTLAINEELKAANLTATPVFMQLLQNAPDAEARKLLIEDRVAVTKTVRESVVPGSAPFAPAGSVATPPASKKDFLSRI